MSQFTQFLGNSGTFPLMSKIFLQSDTWVAPANGWAVFIVIGGGASGGACGKNDATVKNQATGGGAGGLALKRAYVTAGQSFTLTVGAGGAVASVGTLMGGYPNSGNPGGNSQVSASGFTTITANGGGAGQAAQTTGTASLVAGGTGGTATGGDINNTGGAGGEAAAPTANNTAIATGGGSIGVSGTGNTGGNITFALASAGALATGGGGIGGRGGNLTTGAVIHTAGGSSTRAAPDDYIFAVSGAPFGFTDSGQTIGNSILSGNGAAVQANGGAGGGGGGSSPGTGAGHGGTGGGSGGTAVSGFNAIGGPAGIGAGGGAAATTNIANGSATSGRGGDGLIVIQFLGQ